MNNRYYKKLSLQQLYGKIGGMVRTCNMCDGHCEDSESFEGCDFDFYSVEKEIAYRKKIKTMKELKVFMIEHNKDIIDLNWVTLKKHDIGIQELNLFLNRGKYPDFI